MFAGLLAPVPVNAAAKIYSFSAEIWADNWFALYVNGKKVGEDSTPFATERSFNSDLISFKASYPLTIGIIARDYVENASGLEYIGKPNQQVGDGGIIAQIRQTDTGQIVGSTNKSWKVFTTNKAPLNEECVKSSAPLKECKAQSVKAPTSWYSATFKDTSWKNATEFTPAAVGVKDGYFNFTWDPQSSLVWSSDLRLDNTILLRTKILQPKSSAQAAAPFVVSSPDFSNGGLMPKDYTCDGAGKSPALSFSGVPSNAKSLAVLMDTIPGPLRPGEVDIGNHFYLIIYDIPVTTTTIPSGATNIGTLGQNFQGKKPGYTPPCSQGSGLKEYTITAFALTEKLELAPAQVTESVLLKSIEGKVISKATLTGKYQRP
jgi:phosphatidylethanolamine-binding protein (PEBP) family uncharacterized protein